MMGQSKRMSLAESLLNVAVGFGVALVAQLLIFPLFGIHVALRDNVMIGVVFTGVSIARSYVLRRLFNRFHVWQSQVTSLAQAANGDSNA